MAGTLTGFDEALFRRVITATMTMGLPEPDTLKPTFHFRTTSVYPPGTVLDPEGRSIDPRTKAVTTPAKSPVQVPCAVEFTPDGTNGEALLGTFWTDRAVLTLLDDAYATVRAAIEVDLSGRRFLIQKMLTMGLGPVTVYQLFCHRKDTT